MSYRAPVTEYQFLFDHVVGLDQVSATERFGEATRDVTTAILIEAGRMCEEVMAPLQRAGDEHPAVLENGVVRCSPGYVEGYRAIAEGGWVSIAASPEYGGMGLRCVSVAATVPVDDAGPNRSAGASCQRRDQATVPAQADQRCMVWHDEPDRTAGR